MMTMTYISKEEEMELWEKLENEGLLPIEIENGILPECATYYTTETDHHKTTYEVWQGVSGKFYHLIKERS